jgi:DNA recombination protein RmuC
MTLPLDPPLAIALLAAGFAALACLLVLLARPVRELQELRLLAEQALAGQRAEAETTRAALNAAERALAQQVDQQRLAVTREQAESRIMLEAKLREIAEAGARQIAEIGRRVDEQLHQAVERQMEASFQRVLDQFSGLQKAMGDVQATAAQIGDLRRIFANVKTRGGWGETQLRALLDDLLPAGAYATNCRLREGSAEAVEFAVRMPGRGEHRPLLAIDAKFPTEDYERLIDATAAGDAEAERAARRALDARLRLEARKIGSKYVCPPATVDFALLYLPTDGLYAEVARSPGLLEELHRESRVLVMGPSLLPALLRTIQLGFVTLALEQKADEVRVLLGATKSEMARMDELLEKLGRQAQGFTGTIDAARSRTRAVARRLREVEGLDPVPLPPASHAAPTHAGIGQQPCSPAD